nr:hypothetical protein [uncultured Brevundimonas sp.]
MSVEILAHRGWWLDPAEKNQIVSFVRAFSHGYGVETDVRDLGGELVISHDAPQRGALKFEAFLDLYLEHDRPGTLALNIKSDGIADLLRSSLQSKEIDNYFVFDMSVPDTLHYLSRGMKSYVRRSEYEPGSELDDLCSGIWWDSFSGGDELQSALNAVRSNKPAALVSPELHRREHLHVWRQWRRDMSAPVAEQGGSLAICTDFPAEAAEFFNRHESGQDVVK